MAKIITPKELGEIVSKLLTDKQYLTLTGDYKQFLRAVAEIVTFYCGGDYATTIPRDLEKENRNPTIEEEIQENHWYVAIRPNDNFAIDPAASRVYDEYDPEADQ